MDSAERAIEHLCFLQDVNLLYDTALGLYDLDITLLVAQRSQKDPKECLPFLRSLQQETPLRRQFAIDKHLKRYSKALESLVQIDEAFEPELTDFVVEHALHLCALKLLRHGPQHKQTTLYTLYAQYLEQQGQHSNAGLIFEKLGDSESALECYTEALDWKRALSINTTKEIATKLAERCIDAHNFADAAIIYSDYLDDLEEAVRAYSKGCFYDDGIRVAHLRNQPQLLVDVVDVCLMDSFAQISELIADCSSQVKSQVARLRELRLKKEEDPFKFYGDESHDIPDNVSLAPTESTNAPSFFTRYTGKTGGTAQTGVSRKTAKNRRREERKRARGKKGSIYEEEYLVNSMGRLVERLNQTIDEAVRLRDGLIRRNRETHAQQIQTSYVKVLDDVNQVIVEVYTISERDRQRYDDEGNMYLVPELPVPKLEQFPTREFLL